jgi:phosphatidylserine decarboxylase
MADCQAVAAAKALACASALEVGGGGCAGPRVHTFFMRDPDRSLPAGTEFVSPVDGTVLDMLEHNGRLFLVISLNVWDVHVARSPCDAQVVAIHDCGDQLEPGRNDPLRDEPLYFMREKRSPRQRYLELSTVYGLIRIRLITSYLSRRIEFFCRPGDTLERGQRIGRMLFGSTCVVETDSSVPFSVQVGARLTAGEICITRGVDDR